MIVQHMNSSHLNPVTWKVYGDYLLEYSKTNPFDQQFGRPKFKFLKDRKSYDRRFYIENELPAKIMTKTADMFGI